MNKGAKKFCLEHIIFIYNLKLNAVTKYSYETRAVSLWSAMFAFQSVKI
jgi:hypothetical protein